MHFEIKQKKDLRIYLKTLFTNHYDWAEGLRDDSLDQVDTFLLNLHVDVFVGIEYRIPTSNPILA